MTSVLMSNMSKRTLYTVFLAFALLFAQQGAAWHALSHVGSAPRHSQPDKKLPHGELCTKCAVFAQFGAACASTALVVDLPSFSNAPPLRAAPQYYRLTLPFYQSRAPPSLV